MDHHQQDGNHTGDAVDIKGQPASHFDHQARPPGVTHQAQPEEDQVPWFQPSLNALTPYADGIKDQCQADDDHGGGTVPVILSPWNIK